MTTLINELKNKLPKLELKGKVNLEIGCGYKLQKGFIGIDMRNCGQDIVWDVRKGIPLPDESVDMIFSSHVMEHFTDDESKELFLEMYRVLKKGGKTFHIVPHQEDPNAYLTDHKTFWNERRVATLSGVPGLEDFEIEQNIGTTEGNNIGMKQLLFTLRKK